LYAHLACAKYPSFVGCAKYIHVKKMLPMILGYCSQQMYCSLHALIDT